MEGHLTMWDVALAIGVVIDVLIIASGCRAIARVMERNAQAGVVHAVCNLEVDDEFGAFKFPGNERNSHGLLTNPATGLPMLDGVWVDVGGNPYGIDLATNFGSSVDGIGSSSLSAGFGGIHDG